MTAQEVYEQSIKPLPTVDRLKLAQMILNDIPVESLVDFRDSWSDEDLRDFTQAGWQRVEGVIGETQDAESR